MSHFWELLIWHHWVVRQWLGSFIAGWLVNCLYRMHLKPHCLNTNEEFAWEWNAVLIQYILSGTTALLSDILKGNHCQWQMLEKSHRSCGLNVSSPADSKFRAYWTVKVTTVSVQVSSFYNGEYKSVTVSKEGNVTCYEDCSNLELKHSCSSECLHLQIVWFQCDNVFLCPDTWEGGTLGIREGNVKT
jgi:hypothetical protein